LQSLKGVLSVLAPFLLGLVTSYLSDKRSARHDNQSFLIADYQSVVNENRELRRENERLRKELHDDN
jgi:regulator of replication initiation timing